MTVATAMDLDLTPDQAALAEASRGVLTRECPVERVVEIRQASPQFDEALWRKAGAMGWPGAVLAPPLGPGMGVEEAALLLEEAGRVLAPIPLASALASTWLLARARADAGAGSPLAALAEGAAVAALVTGDGCVDDVSQPPVRARKGETDGEWVLDGEARLVRDAQVADWLVAPVVVERGVGLALVGVGHPGVSLAPHTTAGALREATVRFEGAAVATDAIVSRELAGEDLTSLQALLALLEAAELVGACARVLELTSEHATGRFQFGRAIGSFQAVRHRLADMLTDLDSMRWMVRRAASELDGDGDVVRLGSELAVLTAEASRRLVRSAQQIHGGTGFFRDHPLHLYFGRQKAAELSFGLTRTHRERIAARLLAPEEAP